MKPINPVRLLLIGLVLTVAGWSATVVTTRYSLATPVLPATWNSEPAALWDRRRWAYPRAEDPWRSESG